MGTCFGLKIQNDIEELEETAQKVRRDLLELERIRASNERLDYIQRRNLAIIEWMVENYQTNKPNPVPVWGNWPPDTSQTSQTCEG